MTYADWRNSTAFDACPSASSISPRTTSKCALSAAALRLMDEAAVASPAVLDISARVVRASLVRPARASILPTRLSHSGASVESRASRCAACSSAANGCASPVARYAFARYRRSRILAHARVVGLVDDNRLTEMIDRRAVPAAIHLEQRERPLTSRLAGGGLLREHPREVRGGAVEVAEPHQHETVFMVDDQIGPLPRAQVKRALVVLDRLFVFVEPCVRGRQVNVRARVRRIEGNHPFECLDGLFGLAHARQVGPAQPEPGRLIVGVFGEVGSIRRDCGVAVAAGVLGERADPQPLPMAEPIEQAERLDKMRFALLPALRFLGSDMRSGPARHVPSQSRGRAQSPAATGPVGRPRLRTKAVGVEPQRFERCGRRARQGDFLRRDAVERLTQISPHASRELVERRQHGVLAASLGRFGLDRHARLRVNHLCRERVGLADAGDAARENRFDVLPQRNLGRQRLV